MLPASVNSHIYNSPPLFFLHVALPPFLGVLSSKHPKLTILEGEVLPLNLVREDTAKRLVSHTPPLHLLSFTLDLNGGERKSDPDLDLRI